MLKKVKANSNYLAIKVPSLDCQSVTNFDELFFSVIFVVKFDQRYLVNMKTNGIKMSS